MHHLRLETQQDILLVVVEDQAAQEIQLLFTQVVKVVLKVVVLEEVEVKLQVSHHQEKQTQVVVEVLQHNQEIKQHHKQQAHLVVQV